MRMIPLSRAKRIIKREHAANSTHSFVIQEERPVGVFNEVLMSAAVTHGVDGCVDGCIETESNAIQNEKRSAILE